ncbi:MAG: hypothetical protein ACE5D6_08630 [Candidatus Zixiibacteriota bacterium]
MPKYNLNISREKIGSLIGWYYSRIGFMITTAVIISAVIINYFNDILYDEQIIKVYSTIELAAASLMPYMISAVVAAITAIGVITILPIVRSKESARLIQLRLQQLGDGDFSDKSRIDCSNEYLKNIAFELNYAVGTLSNNIAQLKIINRRQWDILELIRTATMKNDSQTALNHIEKMEENWVKIVEIEERLKT